MTCDCHLVLPRDPSETRQGEVAVDIVRSHPVPVALVGECSITVV